MCNIVAMPGRDILEVEKPLCLTDNICQFPPVISRIALPAQNVIVALGAH
jgi:hypothetical protein